MTLSTRSIQKLLLRAVPPVIPKDAEVLTLIIEVPPGDPGTPPHRHPGPVFGYLLEGELLLNVQGEPERVIRTGEAVVVLAIAITGKFVGAYLGARLSRLDHWEGIALGAGMNARGVVEVIVAATGLRLGVLTTATYTIVVLVAIITSLMAPPLLRWALGHIEHSEGERVRAVLHDAWARGTSGVKDHDQPDSAANVEARLHTSADA